MKGRKMVNKEKEYNVPLKEYKPKCEYCKRYRDDVRFRKLYDYIMCEEYEAFICADCAGLIEEEIL